MITKEQIAACIHEEHGVRSFNYPIRAHIESCPETPKVELHTQIERVDKLITMLESINPKQVLLSSWYEASPESTSCGTAACLAGWASLYPATQADGWQVGKTSCLVILPQYANLYGVEAVAAYLGISWWYADDLIKPVSKVWIEKELAKHTSDTPWVYSVTSGETVLAAPIEHEVVLARLRALRKALVGETVTNTTSTT